MWNEMKWIEMQRNQNEWENYQMANTREWKRSKDRLTQINQ